MSNEIVESIKQKVLDAQRDLQRLKLMANTQTSRDIVREIDSRLESVLSGCTVLNALFHE